MFVRCSQHILYNVAELLFKQLEFTYSTVAYIYFEEIIVHKT